MVLTEEVQIIFYVALIFHIITSVVIIVASIIQRNERTKYMSFLFGVNTIIFAVTILLGNHIVDFQIIDYVAFVGYSIILSYVVTIEIPGYVILSRHDSNLTSILSRHDSNLTSILSRHSPKINSTKL